MKKQGSYLLVSSGLALLFGFMLGAVIQKIYGFGDLLRSVGIPYSTPVSLPPPPTSTVFEIPRAAQGKLSLFVLAGQSNMVGWAPLPQSQVEFDRIYVFGNDYRWRIALEPIDDPSNQVDRISEDRAAGFGPSLAFASTLLARQPDIVIGLIPCAKSSSAIIEWQRNLSDQSLYGSCLKRVRAASSMGRIAGILFFQGETDTADRNRYPQFDPRPEEWSQLFLAFVNNMREDLQVPSLPVVFAQIGANPKSEDTPYWEIVQEQQQSITLPWVAMITTDDLSLMDGLHFTEDSYRIIGYRFAKAYSNLLEQHDQ